MTATVTRREGPASPAVTWARRNLVSTPFNTALTVVMTLLMGGALLAIARWALFEADWTIVRVNLTLFLVGRYPRDQLWRPWVATGLTSVLVGLAAGWLDATAKERAAVGGVPQNVSGWRSRLVRFWPFLLLAGVILAMSASLTPLALTAASVLAGVGAFQAARRLPSEWRRRLWLLAAADLVAIYLVLARGAPPDEWGGLHLNLFLTVAGILLAFPFGLLLSLARRSSLPALRTLSVLYIEFVRGVPLITVLLFGAFAIGFLLPPGFRPGLTARALMAITLFEAAYVAEVVRGGLQSVPKGQVEAAQALGLSVWKSTRLIVLPQALRAVIPAIVGQFISLFKDTSLVSVIGLLEILRVAQITNTQPEFLAQGLHAVTLAFAGLVFWVGSYYMSKESQRLERRLGVGER